MFTTKWSRLWVLAFAVSLGGFSTTFAAEKPIEIPTLLWGDSKRADGTTRHWDPAPLIDLKATLVCVAYRPFTPNGERWHSVGMTPPQLLAHALTNTRPELDECHRHGIKVIGYADTIMFHPDMMQGDGIEFTNLYAIDRHGKKVINTIWDKSGAGVSCVMNPQWVELQQQVTLTTAKAGFDGLQFDVYPYAIDPGYLCCCEHCKRAWEKHSRKIFGKAQEFPGLESGKLDFRKAVDREFKTWRLDCFSAFVKGIEKRVQKKYPDFIIIMNHGAGTPDYTSEAVAGALTYPSSELWHLKLGDDSSLYLYSSTEAACGGQAIGLINFAEQYDPPYRYRVALAEAFGAGGTFYAVVRKKTDGEAGRISHEYGDFLRAHQSWFNGSQSAADVAVLYSWRDQAYLQGNPVTDAKVEFDPKRNHYQRAAAVLARLGVPHDCLITEKGLTRRTLSKYKTVVVPELALLSDKDAAALKSYVQRGGKLLVIGQLGTVSEKKTEWKQRDASLLASWLGKEPGTQPTRLGKGLIVSVPKITTEELIGAPPPPVAPDDAIAQIKQPGPLAIPLKTLTLEFIAAVDSVNLTAQLRIEASSEVQATVRGHKNRRAIHLIRFGATDAISNHAATVTFALPKGRRAVEVSAWTPGVPEAGLKYSWEATDEGIRVKLDRLESYAMIGVQLAPK